MINTSKEYRELIENSRKFLAKTEVLLANGTVLNIDDDIISGGMKFSDGTSNSGTFQIGSAIINSHTLILDNLEDQFSLCDFTGSILRPQIGLILSATTEWLRKGVFTVDIAQSVGSTIVLTALDNMNKFDTPFSDVAINFPCSVLQLLQAVSLYCGVPLATSTFLNADFIINRRPNDEAITCREIVSWIAQLSGNFARCNADGALELKWYDIGAFEQSDNVDGGTFDSSTPYSSGDNADGGNFTDYNSGDSIDGGTFLQMDRYHHIYALNQVTIGTDDVIITGVQVKAMGTESDYGETVLFGSEGYVIRIDDNPLIQEGNASIIANSVGAKIVGMRFRPLNISALSDPSIEAGDVAIVSDRKGSYQTLITNLSYTIGNFESISCDAETPSKNSSTRYSAQTKTIAEARKIAKQEINFYELAVQQLNSVALNAMGYYPTTVIQEDGSRIDYAHDKPKLEESQIVYKKTISGFFISKDGGKTYTSGMTADGNILANVLTAIGIKAEWLVVGGTISGLRIEANTGMIGPYNISSNGLASNTMEFFDDGNYPLIWMTKPGEGGWGSNGSARANYEPSVALVRSIEDGIETDVRIMARDDTKGTKGNVSIERIDLSTNRYKSQTELTESSLEWWRYDSSGTSVSHTLIQDDLIMLSKNGHSFNIVLDDTTGDVYINGANIYINGVKQ